MHPKSFILVTMDSLATQTESKSVVYGLDSTRYKVIIIYIYIYREYCISFGIGERSIAFIRGGTLLLEPWRLLTDIRRERIDRKCIPEQYNGIEWRHVDSYSLWQPPVCIRV